MGYHTYFVGQFAVSPQLRPEHAEYLTKFGNTRRVKRSAAKTELMKDPVREAVGLPVGPDGCYFVGGRGYLGQDSSSDVINNNVPPHDQPGLWCQWVPVNMGQYIAWDQGEKFYCYTEWLQYLIDNFLKPWGYTVEGVVSYQGDDPEDFGVIRVDGGDTVVRSPGKRLM